MPKRLAVVCASGGAVTTAARLFWWATTQVPDLAAKPVAWISNVQVGGGPEDPPEFDTVCVAGDQKPDDRNKWTPLYTAPPDLAARVARLEGLLSRAQPSHSHSIKCRDSNSDENCLRCAIDAARKEGT